MEIKTTEHSKRVCVFCLNFDPDHRKRITIVHDSATIGSKKLCMHSCAKLVGSSVVLSRLRYSPGVVAIVVR